MQRTILPLAILLALTAAPIAAAAGASVKVMGGFFEPAAIEVRAGDEVTFTNTDSIAHTVTSSWDQGASFDEVLRTGGSFVVRFEELGTWGVHCRPHSGMEMTVAAIAGEAGAGGAKLPALGILLLIGAIAAATLLSRRG